MKIYNTMTRKKEEFKTIEKNTVKMYVCGPTVYNYFHIGNARPFLFFDVVRRYFEYAGYKVIYTQNMTDIDDKLIEQSKKENIPVSKIAEKYIKAFYEDTAALDIKKVDHQPKATEFIGEMIKLIRELEEKGYAYQSGGDVYFSVSKVKDYGKLSGKKLDELRAGARVEENVQKQHPADFTLWKKAKPGEPKWKSPWGEGRPGWHTECVVMSRHYLGETFDIHGGGSDLVFPHHENEIAQAEAVSGKPLANYWMHNGYLN
ncbi:MAG: cysteine--tRNA ligase, partial [Candidatus Cloacimonas sp. 4484_275]